jgi:Domain of unknown function (DUF4062)
MFVSSLFRGDMAAIRQGGRSAVESLGMYPVMFETQPASDRNSRRALLDQIPSCDAYLLLLGAEYGEPGHSGVSPTEEEFEEALRSGLAILGLVQEGGDREPRQQEFVSRVRGTWEEGRFAPTFTNSTDVVTAVVSALNGWRNRVPDAAQREAAVERVRELARGSDRQGMTPGGAKLRTVVVPLVRRPLLDAVRLTDSATVDAVIAAARACGLISQSQGVEPSVAADDSIRIKYAPGRGFEQFEVVVGADGAVIAEGPVGGSRDATASLGWMVVMHDRIPGAVSQGLRFTEAVWHAIDTRGDIDQVLLAAAVSGANGKSYSFEEPGNRVSMGSSHSVPDLIVVPAQPLLVRRQDLTLPENATRLQAEIRRRFEAAGAVNAG